MRLRTLIPIIFVLYGCKSHDVTVVSETSHGATASELKDAATAHEEGLDLIAKEAYTIQKIAGDNKDIIRSSDVIIDTADSLEYIAELLRREKASKAEYEALVKAYNDVINKQKTGENRIMLLLRVIGIASIPIGILLWRLLGSKDMLVISAVGPILFVSTRVDSFIDRWGEWIIGIIFVAVIAIIARIVYVNRRALISSVGVSEALKEVLAKKDDATLKKLFGEGSIKGLIGHDTVTEKQITDARKTVAKKAKPIKEQV